MMTGFCKLVDLVTGSGPRAAKGALRLPLPLLGAIVWPGTTVVYIP